jgi:DNA polymerase III alpha subunit
MMKHDDFVHLHDHSQFSLLDGATRIEAMVKRAKEYNMPALALTDHGNTDVVITSAWPSADQRRSTIHYATMSPVAGQMSIVAAAQTLLMSS